ncbi:MAG: hypothetical protein ACD_23C00307G0001 [uncultured bacterium]|nr:MAG: hypothetical protein ACD_23C00307G0001 [uncultured bacterium]
MQKISYTLLALFGFISLSAQAEDNLSGQFASQFNVAKTLAAQYEQEAKKVNKNATLSAEAGRAFYTKKVVVDGKDLSCSACHSDDPTKVGQHNETKKAIDPMAISVIPERFSDVKKVEKNFAKHCKDLYKKDCSAQDKGDFLTYLLSVK